MFLSSRTSSVPKPALHNLVDEDQIRGIRSDQIRGLLLLTDRFPEIKKGGEGVRFL